MADLHRALLDIRTIRRQIAETSAFRGYGPLTISMTALSALLAGFAQARWLPFPAMHPGAYVALWLGTAVFSAALIAAQMFTRAHRLHSGMADEMIRLAVAQFLPAAVAGAVLPFVLLQSSATIFWILPGLWQLIFALGVFASARSLPRPVLFAGAWFLLTGFTCLRLGPAALTPWPMAFPFAVGMALVAAIHHIYAAKDTADEE